MNFGTNETQAIREEMARLVAPEGGFDLVDWVNARTMQFEKIISKYGTVVKKIYLQVNRNDLESSLNKAYNYPIEIESWGDIAEGTYRIEFETDNDTLDMRLGLLHGVFGHPSEAETVWVLWRNDNFEVDHAKQIAPKL